MNSRFHFIGRLFLILALTYSLSIGGAEARQSRWGGGRLIVQRSANFGTYVTLQLWIDGREVANIMRNRHYDRFIPAGSHILTVTSVPNNQNFAPTSMRLSVHPGALYIFTGGWDPDLGVVLRRADAIAEY
jgi:hypothetical protein